MLYHRRSHPYNRNGTKRTSNQTNVANLTGKQCNVKTKESRPNVATIRPRAKTNTNPISNGQNVHKIGQYLILDSNPGSTFSRAIECQNRAELSCKIIDSKKLGDVLTPYTRLESHENINEIVDVIVGETKAYLFMQNSHGDLHSYVKTKKRLREEEAVTLFRQIVKAVCSCHEAGIVLRDLKLRKFVFKNKDRWVICFFPLKSGHVQDTFLCALLVKISQRMKVMCWHIVVTLLLGSLLWTFLCVYILCFQVYKP